MVKRIVKSIVFLSILFLSVNSIKACEIEFKIEGEAKEVYEVGDIVVVKVIVTYTHKVCPEGIQKTKFQQDGLKVLQATKWKESSANIWVRKLKLEITGNESGKLLLSAERTCDKDGGFGKILLQCKPV